jgi:hypothetical protein
MLVRIGDQITVATSLPDSHQPDSVRRQILNAFELSDEPANTQLPLVQYSRLTIHAGQIQLQTVQDC